jgi:protein-L-isoaspartate(D-aspartate) O-methyltransferase
MGTQDLARLRRSFAQSVLRTAGVADARIEDAFAATPREVFAGPGPWLIVTCMGYERTPDADPAHLYRDVLVALDPRRGINIGEPSLHARCIAALDPRPGQHVVHIGAGSGYYTAILAQLVPGGHVHAYEINAALAARAKANLAPYGSVEVHAGSGVAAALPPADIVYVSAGATHPAREWLAALRMRGRLLFPLTPDEGFGGMLLVTRGIGQAWDARFISTARFIGCEGARDRATGRGLSTAFAQGGWRDVRALRFDAPDATCWFAGKGWWLSTRSPGQ